MKISSGRSSKDIFNNENSADESGNIADTWEDKLRNHIREGIIKDKEFLKKVNKEVESIIIDESLKASNGVKQEAAKLLGWGRNTLAKKAKDS